jgi:hypothetical protein
MGIPGFNEPPYKYAHVSGAQTNLAIKAASGTPLQGILHSVTINNIGSAATITLTDNTVGGSSPATIAIIGTPTAEVSYIYDIGFNNGLLVTSGGTTPVDMTIAYS